MYEKSSRYYYPGIFMLIVSFSLAFWIITELTAMRFGIGNM